METGTAILVVGIIAMCPILCMLLLGIALGRRRRSE
jgi:hypothetical protein